MRLLVIRFPDEPLDEEEHGPGAFPLGIGWLGRSMRAFRAAGDWLHRFTCFAFPSLPMNERIVSTSGAFAGSPHMS